MGETAFIRQLIARDVFDYQSLLGALSAYAKPRDKITRLLAGGDIVRVKKGLYCFGDAFQREPICLEHLANLIYGPSYVSLDYALGYHGLIPERVETVTSVSTRRSRGFATPLGQFSYRTLGGRRYPVGVTLEAAGQTQFLMASAEKALIDKVWTDARFSGQRVSDFEAYLLDDLRIDRGALRELDSSRLSLIARAYGSRKIDALLSSLMRLEDS
jgi:predicted transcriptional regulator of viral defense system